MARIDRDYDLGELNRCVMEDWNATPLAGEQEEEAPHGEGLGIGVMIAIGWFAVAAVTLALCGLLRAVRDL